MSRSPAPRSAVKDPRTWGWFGFTLSAIAFFAVAVRDGDVLAGIASLFFLIACFLFLAAHLRGG